LLSLVEHDAALLAQFDSALELLKRVGELKFA